MADVCTGRHDNSAVIPWGHYVLSLAYRNNKLLGKMQHQRPLQQWMELSTACVNCAQSSAYCLQQICASCLSILPWASIFPPQKCCVLWGIWAPSNAWYIGPMWVYIPNRISVCFAIFAQHKVVRNTQTCMHSTHESWHTDRAECRSVAIGHKSAIFALVMAVDYKNMRPSSFWTELICASDAAWSYYKCM